MSRTAETFVLLSVATGLAVSACSSGDIPVGSTQQSALQLKKDGSPTGNGSTCSWDDSVSNDPATPAAPSANGAYKTGDAFKSLDGCNDCSCTAKGIACTERACDAPRCSEEAKVCPDGSSVGRTGPNCAFAACPGGSNGPCSQVAKQCPDGSYVSRTGPNCAFAACPTGQACTEEAKQCPNGSYVGRTGPNCAFAPCP